MIKINYSNKALKDLDEIKTHLSFDLQNEIVTIKTISKIYKRILLLENFPEIGSPVKFNSRFKTNFRYLICDKYLIFYYIKNDNVCVVRVLHSKQNYLQKLFNYTNDELN